MEKKNERVKVEKKGKKILIVSIILLIIIGVILFWWFNRRFEVQLKYNINNYNDEVLYVKYLNLIKEEDINNDVKANGKTFVGWFETYYLDGKEIEAIKNDSKKENTICMEGFKLNSDKTKCVSTEEFDFKATKIKKDTILEALWSGISFTINPTNKTINVGDNFKITASVSGSKDKTVKFTSSNSKIATVDSAGKVVGVKAGETTIIAESNGIKKKCNVIVKEVVKETPKKEEPVVQKDEGTISLKASDQCIVGPEGVNVTATVSGNAIDKTINWTLPKCYTSEKISDTVYKLTRTGCNPDEEKTFTVSAKLNNGNSDSLKITYEPTLSYNVYDGNKEIHKNSSGKYIGNNIVVKTNTNAIFTAKAEFDGSDIVNSKTDNSVTITPYKRGTITIKTTCGQSSSLVIEEAIY